jgi:hypothetical protein
VDQLYFESGYLVDGYYTVVREAASALPVTMSFAAQGDIADATGYYIPDYIAVGYIAGAIKQAEAQLSSTFTQTVMITHIQGVALFAFSNAAIAVQVQRIRSTNITVSSVFDIATNVQRIGQGDCDVDAVFSAIINGLRSRDFNLETQAAFSFAASVDKLKLAQAELSVACSISVTARKIRDAHLTGTGVAALTCSPTVLGVLSAQLQSTEEVPGESKSFKQVVHTQVENKTSMNKESLLT